MKKLLLHILFLLMVFTVQAQTNKADKLRAVEKDQQADQKVAMTATLKSATRLFGAEDDLTSVILIIPSGSVVPILSSDSAYLRVSFEEAEGYIHKSHAIIGNAPLNPPQVSDQDQVEQQAEPAPVPQESRFTYLENKYGSNMAARLMAGKIWKGMNSEMVKDSWGTADKINRIISGNVIKEEWIYKNTWLYFENNTLLEWGPVER